MNRKLIIVFCNIIIIISVLYFSFISPYKYEWNKALIQVDFDKLLVLKIVWILILLISVLVPILFRPKRKVVYAWYFFIFLYACYKTISLFVVHI
jgi:hypothetical protein